MTDSALDQAIDSYFARVAQGRYTKQHEAEVNLLPRAKALALTKEFDYHHVIQALDGLLLDDPDTSDHHFLARCAPLAGMVFYLSIRGSARAVFPDLEAFLAATDTAINEQSPLSELHPRLAPRAEGQQGLEKLIAYGLEEDRPEIITALIACMDFVDVDWLECLATHPDFFIAETIADEICLRPSAALRPVAQQCAQSSHAQVRRAGERALRKCR